jgi:ribosome-binding protein aMBF1 (putative translation factor)
LLPSDDAEAHTKNPEVAKKLEAIEKVKLKAKKTAEETTEAAKEAKATVAK